ncbi:MAG: penicillin-binding protein 1C [Desulfobacteraceae bacterium]|nr:MAG: penicillin-binding protein 1C [Desulfobacteraceae bacterium]
MIIHKTPLLLVALCCGFLLLGLIAFYYCLPRPLFRDPYATVILDRDHALLGALIADDGQWRFPPEPMVPEKFAKALIEYEDRRFFQHNGIDPLALARALIQNIRGRKIVSGASTLSMQITRLARKNRPRTFFQKTIEMIMALRLETLYSKQEILALYAAHAPFGGNIVGLPAAARQYFGRDAHNLSWAEACMLAVLPNSPALIHPGRNRDLLLQKRNRLLDRLYERKVIDELSCRLAKAEPLPPKPFPLPQSAPHLLARVKSENRQIVRTTLQKTLQIRATEVVWRHHERLALNGIQNAAVLILDVPSGQVLAYVGNVPDFPQAPHGNHVDAITANRSTGSLLKPFLYAAMLEAGELLPTQLIPDVPTRLGGFAPENFSREFQGAVPAYMALARSLNVPAVRLLQSYSVDRFTMLLKNLGLTGLNRPAHEYGLALILGGAEGSLWDLTGMYAGMARSVNQAENQTALDASFFAPSYIMESSAKNTGLKKQTDSLTLLNAPACWLTLEAMLLVTRPDIESAWQDFASAHKIAWKTGTSFGFRDAWAIGMTPQYCVGVWVGNVDGEGRPALTGITTAAPILFDLFDLLEGRQWFEQPLKDLVQIDVCSKSGFRAGPNCQNTQKTWVTATGLRSRPCPYCKMIICDKNRKFRVHGDCEPITNITPVKWFVLPPTLEYYYRKRHSDYYPLPPWRPDCLAKMSEFKTSALSLIYPDKNGRIYIPIELDGRPGKAVFAAAHREPQTAIYWHLDEKYLGETREVHQMEVAPEPGDHKLVLVDEHGEELVQPFSVLSK